MEDVRTKSSLRTTRRPIESNGGFPGSDWKNPLDICSTLPPSPCKINLRQKKCRLLPPFPPFLRSGGASNMALTMKPYSPYEGEGVLWRRRSCFTVPRMTSSEGAKIHFKRRLHRGVWQAATALSSPPPLPFPHEYNDFRARVISPEWPIRCQ